MSKASKQLSAQEAELKQQIEQSRAGLMDTLSSLTHQLQPKTQVSQAAEGAKYKAEEVKYDFMTTVDEAREGDQAAVKRLATTAGGVAAAVGAAMLTRKLKRRRRSR